MKIIISFNIIFIVMVFCGCSPAYIYTGNIKPENKLNREKCVVISIPEDGVYSQERQIGSGEMTAEAVKSAFQKHNQKVYILRCNQMQDCLSSINNNECSYYVRSEILHWEDNLSGISALPDVAEIEIVFYETKSKNEIGSLSFRSKANYFSVFSSPQDLINKPIDEFVGQLYVE